MKKHSKVFRLLTLFIAMLISVTGLGISASAATISLTCQYLLCSNKLNATTPLKVGSTFPSSVPEYAGQSLTSLNTGFNNSDRHYIPIYCSDYGDTTLKKRHTFVVANGPHKYTIATNTYTQTHAGDNIVLKDLNSSGRPQSRYEKDPVSGESILVKTLSASDVANWHFRKYRCGDTYSISEVTNIGSGNTISVADATTAVKGLGGCSLENYFLESHNKKSVRVDHNNPKGGFISYNEPDGSHASVYYKDLVYDSKTDRYKLPNSQCYIKKADLPEDSLNWAMYIVKIYWPSGEIYNGTFFTLGASCGTKYYCDECGWSQISYVAGYPVTSLKTKNSTTHTFDQKCKSCGILFTTTTENHNFEYSNYRSITNSDGTSTKHYVDRRCKTTKKALGDSSTVACGYTDTISENHSWKTSGYINVNDNLHRYTRTCTGCGYSETLTDSHTYQRSPATGFTQLDSESHTYTNTCTLCKHVVQVNSNHFYDTKYSVFSSDQHSIENVCECGYELKIEYGNHHDDDKDCYCDDCGYLMTMFSVTVPSSMSLVMDKNGNVYSATNAAITNNSSGQVKVSSVQVSGQNGWNVVDYKTNMAKEKVDSKKIGLMMKDSSTNDDGYFTLNSDWTINKNDSLALPYSASVSATSTPIENREVLKVVFVIDWSGN